MCTNNDKGYLTPEVEVLAIAVERGFDNSFTLDEWGDGGSEEGEAD